MLEKLAIVEKNVLFYSRLSSEYHPLHHIHKFFFSLGDILRSEAVVRIWRTLRTIVSSLKASPIIHSRVRPYAAFTLFCYEIVCPIKTDACYIFRFL